VQGHRKSFLLLFYLIVLLQDFCFQNLLLGIKLNVFEINRVVSDMIIFLMFSNQKRSDGHCLLHRAFHKAKAV
jgi:hypothetical protein